MSKNRSRTGRERAKLKGRKSGMDLSVNTMLSWDNKTSNPLTDIMKFNQYYQQMTGYISNQILLKPATYQMVKSLDGSTLNLQVTDAVTYQDVKVTFE